MSAKKLPNLSNTLSLKQSLKGEYVVMFIITLLVAVASISGVLASHTLYPIEELRNGFVATDILNLLFVLPMLVGGYILNNMDHRWGYFVAKKSIGICCWSGVNPSGESAVCWSFDLFYFTADSC